MAQLTYMRIDVVVFMRVCGRTYACMCVCAYMRTILMVIQHCARAPASGARTPPRCLHPPWTGRERCCGGRRTERETRLHGACPHLGAADWFSAASFAGGAGATISFCWPAGAALDRAFGAAVSRAPRMTASSARWRAGACLGEGGGQERAERARTARQGGSDLCKSGRSAARASRRPAHLDPSWPSAPLPCPLPPPTTSSCGVM